MTRGYFVAGTDTGVGKTLVSCALLRAFAARGLRVAGMKPVAAGCEITPDGLRCDDVERLLCASNVVAARELVNPYAFAPPIAPHLAAQQARIEIDLSRIEAAFRQLAVVADMVVVEGVGGLLVPLNAREDTGDLMRCLKLPVILVVGMRLGCLSHALLTAEALAQRGLRLAGWVANRIDPQMSAFEDNVIALQARLESPLLGVVACYPEPISEAVDSALSLDSLCQMDQGALASP